MPANASKMSCAAKALRVSQGLAMGDASSGEWQGLVCRHGLLLVRGEWQRSVQKSVLFKAGKLSAAPFTASQALEAKMVLLGAPEDSLLLSEETGELAQPPIRFTLDEDLVEALARPSYQRSVAMTHSGPRDPDKPCNQDFAVAADLVIGKKAFSVAVVCDGVSQKVFWPERSSRIAGLVALETLHRFLKGGEDRTLPELLQASITRAYRNDRVQLGDAPSLMFDKEYYGRQRDREANWYQTTVLVAALGCDGGFVSYVGDGAIVDLPRGGGFDQKLQTTEDFGLDHCASLLFQAHEFEKPVRLAPGERTLLIASDGVDRTAEASGSRENFFRATASRIAGANAKDRGKALFAYLDQTAKLPFCASDNISIAWLTAPDERSGGEVMRAFGKQLDPPTPPPPAPPPAPPPQPIAPSAPQQPAYAPRATVASMTYPQQASTAARQQPYVKVPSRDRSDYGDQARRTDWTRIVLITAAMLLLVVIGYMLADLIFGEPRRPPGNVPPRLDITSSASAPPSQQDQANSGEPTAEGQDGIAGPATGSSEPNAGLPGALADETRDRRETGATENGKIEAAPPQRPAVAPVPTKPPTNSTPVQRNGQQNASPGARSATPATPPPQRAKQQTVGDTKDSKAATTGPENAPPKTPDPPEPSGDDEEGDR